jgi:hypothetical protein
VAAWDLVKAGITKLMKKEKIMSTTENNRVLARAGARELTLEEIDWVSAAAMTQVCSRPLATATHTGPGDGDACGDQDSDTGLV